MLTSASCDAGRPLVSNEKVYIGGALPFTAAPIYRQLPPSIDTRFELTTLIPKADAPPRCSSGSPHAP